MTVTASIAVANIGGISVSVSAFLSPTYGTRTPVVVDKEDLIFDCDIRDDKLLCTFEAHYHLYNPTDETQGILAALYGVDTDDVTAVFNGEKQKSRLSVEEFNAVDRVVNEETADFTFRHRPRNLLPWRNKIRLVDDYGKEIPGAREAFERNLAQLLAFEISMDPATRNILEVRGKIVPSKNNAWGIATLMEDLALMRHPLLGYRANRGPFLFRYFVSPIKTWGDVGVINVTVKCPEELHGVFYLGFGNSDNRASKSSEDGNGWKQKETGRFDTDSKNVNDFYENEVYSRHRSELGRHFYWSPYSH